MDQAETEALYDAVAQAIDTARGLGPSDEMESIFLATLAFAALRDLGCRDRADELIALCLRDIAPSDK